MNEKSKASDEGADVLYPESTPYDHDKNSLGDRVEEVGPVTAHVPDSHRGLRMRHVQLIAISGSIGSALFISIGIPFTSGGPLGLIIGMALWCTVVWASANCLIEITTLLPIDGGFIGYATRFVDESFGMALGWNYTITQFALICYDITAINLIVDYWKPLHPAIMITVTLVVILLLNIWNVRFFGEAEFWISLSKIFLIIGLTLYTLVTMCGGNPLNDKYGFRFWRNPGVFAGNTEAKKIVQGIWDSLCWSTFAVVGPDYLSMVSGEVKSPRRVMPRAFKTTVYRIFGFYLMGALCVSIVCAANDPALLGAIENKAAGAAKSPYVISMNRLGIPALPSIVNAVILVSCISTGNAFTFTGSRALYGLALKRQAPQVFARVNRNGVPYVAVLVTLAFGCLSYLSVSTSASKVLNWWISLVGSAQLVSWTAIGITWFRFTAGLKKQGLWPHMLPQRGYLQPLSAYWLVVWSPLVFIFQGYYVFLGGFDAVSFVFAYGSIFIFGAIYLVSKIYDYSINKRHRWGIPLEELDFNTDIKEIEHITAESEAARAARSKGKGQKVSDFFF
ncbi:amino acid permease [Cutaneotrichosporon oleaginosum]|uniref:Amino acid permease n=1 Tax=Cutaneotrichosporon oleaginosum TaxID=879819 RepID=A0A0J0XMJ0_9TREE|nr:amino acid permease [Cutaneotrichosporon oleaginosum]KLT42321.1 amino acid permease [Cutaneotrichosporon oleaginosum]TXT04141.1 hypothetical protein COLE_07838 [Cutaneotrichosporon oleaginosum]